MAISNTGGDDAVRISFPIVDLPEGEVLLSSLDELERTVTYIDADLGRYERDSQAIQEKVDEKLRLAGATLIRDRRDPVGAEPARKLLAREDVINEQINTTQTKMRGVFTNPMLRLRIGQLRRERDAIDEQLSPMLIAAAKASEGPSEPTADRALAEARELSAELAQQTEQATRNKAAREKIRDHLAQRKEVQSRTGFDSLYDAALLAKFGLQAVPSPIIQKPGEETYLVCSAILAKRKTRTHYEGSSSGWSFPVFHGIRYRVGSFRGYPISQEYISEADDGNLVLTNQRVAFAGEKQGTSIPLDKLLHVWAYTDGLSFIKEGRASAEMFMFDAPNRFLFYLNYLLAHRPASGQQSKSRP